MRRAIRTWLAVLLLAATPALAGPAMLLSLGDSLVAGGPILGTGNPNWTQILQTGRLGTSKALAANNAGVGGTTSAQALSLWTASYRGKGYTHLVILTGTNDLSAGTSAATVLANIQSIITSAQSDTSGRAGGVIVTVLTVPPRGGSTPWDSTKETQRLSLRTSILALTGVTPVDLESMAGTGSPVEMAVAYRTADLLHFNGTPTTGGSQKVADLINAAVTW